MKKIYSKIDPSVLLHIVLSPDDITEKRMDIISADNFLQLSVLNLQGGNTFKPHMHVWKDTKGRAIAQESWVCLQGSVLCHYYDMDGSFIEEHVINEKQVSITLLGGHNYTAISDDTKVLEFKTGPYLGTELDKRFI